MTPQYHCLGHVCMDLMDDGQYALGGTASYSALVAKGLGLDTTVWTSYGPDFQFEDKLSGVRVQNHESDQSTIFTNRYSLDGRIQEVLARANQIKLPDKILDGIVHFCPIANELPLEVVSEYNTQSNLTIATPQGWMRKWDEHKVVKYRPMDWTKLSSVDFVIMSEDDVPDIEKEITNITSNIDQLIVTRGEKGASIYIKAKESFFSASAVTAVDPTGAGDTFATAFAVKYYQTQDIVQSMNHANMLAGVCVGHSGVDFISKL